ncbi:hypothetical protein HPB52_006593 [Rhipicephalus sanguineus]|uniref:RING-type domain-containing protein n=1 Tax=Rhipicephalus sanguineus TaxID=34632 RepID=A0A9D4PUW4_RHISA|nr:hypothetical protein HPB52_006593 [Rhipicephalus sanguineus]
MAQPGSSQERDGDGPEDRRSKKATKFHPSQARSNADFNASRPAYVLSGFDRALLKTGRKISFLERLPTSRVCVMCTNVPARVIPLPCGHVGCKRCVTRAFVRCRESSRRPVCPLHRVPLVNSGIQVVDNSRYLLKKTVLCMNFRLGCPYRLKLRHLNKHCDEQCKFTPVPCELCEEVIAECHFQQHSQQCPRRDPAKDLQH